MRNESKKRSVPYIPIAKARELTARFVKFKKILNCLTFWASYINLLTYIMLYTTII